MSKRSITNFIILIAVICGVAGVAAYQAQRRRNAPTDRPGPAGGADAARPGEVCPEPPPIATDGGVRDAQAAPAASEPASAPATASAPTTQKLPRMVDLGADKCIPCKQLAPILEELKQEYAGRVTVEFIDVWRNPKAGEPYKIRVIPTQIFFDASGKEIWRHEGFLPKADFIAKFKEMGVK